MDANTNPLYIDPTQQVQNDLVFNDQVMEMADPLTLEIDDDELVKVVDRRINESKKFFEEKYNLTERRKKNELYLFGRQTGEKEKNGELKDYETRSSDNALYEIEASLKPLAMSKLPDIIVTAGSDDDDKKKEAAKNLSIAVNDVNKQDEQRQVLGLGFKHLPSYFTAVIKARWNVEKGDQGDYCFEIVSPEYIIVDHTSQSKNPDDMSFIAQCVPMTLQDALMRFPDKKVEILDRLQKSGNLSGATPNWRDLASEFKVWEVWFDWYKKKGTDELINANDPAIFEPGVKWERVSGVLWKYDTLLLKKMLDPNYDQVGEDKFFIYGTPGDETTKQEVTPEMMLMSALQGQQLPNVKTEKVYHNYFQRPHKPFYFFGYDQWGKIAYDETSRIEQNIRNQENLDDQNKTIMDQLKTRVKHIWSKDSGMRSGDVQRLDMDNPKMDALVEGNPNEVHAAVVPERPDVAQFNALQDTRSRMYALSGATAVRGQLQSQVATSNQIAREADFTRADDLVADTVNTASQWMAEWQMQFIVLRYTDDHMKQILGAKGEVTYLKIRRDMYSDGMLVMIKASSTDKLKAQRNAMDTAKLGPPYTNPLDFFQDMDMNDPEGRTERGLMFLSDPQGYYVKYALGIDDTQGMATALNGAPAGQVGAPAVAPQGQQPPTAPQNPTSQNTSAVPAQPPTGAPMGSPRML